MNTSTARALLRIGRRNVGRNRWRSLLVVVLIGLPVAGMVGGAAVLKTVTPAPERQAVNQMGRADFLVYPGEGGTDAALRARLPSGSVVEPILMEGGSLVLPGYTLPVTLSSEDPAGLAMGMLRLTGGRWPSGPDEVAISNPVAAFAKASIGGSIELRELGRLRVVGIVENELALTARIALVDPSLARDAAAAKGTVWLVGLPQGVDPAEIDLPTNQSNGAGPAPQFIATSRTAILVEASAVGPTTIVLGGLALVDAALVAAAAFAVGVRRRQRELGLLAGAGATPGHIAGTVLCEGLVLGLIGAAFGVLVGIAGAAAIYPSLDALTGHRNPTFMVDGPLLMVAVVMGIVTTLAAAFAPARSAARIPVLAALSGRRPPISSARRSLALGIGAVLVGVLLTAAGAAMRSAGGGDLSTLLLLGGAVLGTLGFGACSPWLLGQLERPARRLPLASRIALRDTARARSRNGPIVTALLAATAATVAIAAYQSSVEASNAQRWRPPLLDDQVYLQGPGAAEAGRQAVRDLHGLAGAVIPGAGSDARYVWVSPGASKDPNLALVTQNVTVGDAELLRALGAESAIDDMAAGKIIVLAEKPTRLTSVTVHIDDASDGSVISAELVPARLVALDATAEDLPGAIMSASTAERLGVPVGKNTQRYVLRLREPIDDTAAAKVGAIAAAFPDTWSETARPPDTAGGGFRIVLGIASLLFALTVTGIAVALGEAESRPEQRTLLAVGADPGVRRRITAARAGTIALLGGMLAVPAGLLPVWGLLASRNLPLVVPAPEVLAVVLLLPILAIVATWVLARPIPAWSAFREQGAR